MLKLVDWYIWTAEALVVGLFCYSAWSVWWNPTRTLPKDEPRIWLNSSHLLDFAAWTVLVQIIGIVIAKILKTVWLAPWIASMSVVTFCILASMVTRRFERTPREFLVETEERGVYSLHVRPKKGQRTGVAVFREASADLGRVLDELIAEAPAWCTKIRLVSPWFVCGTGVALARLTADLERRYGPENVKVVDGHFSLIKSIFARVSPTYWHWWSVAPWWRPLPTRGFELDVAGIARRTVTA